MYSATLCSHQAQALFHFALNKVGLSLQLASFNSALPPPPLIPTNTWAGLLQCFTLRPLKSEEPHIQPILWPFSLFANVKFALKIYEVLIPFFGFVYLHVGVHQCVYVRGYVILCFFVCVREFPFPVANIVGLLRWQGLV